jgi:hypothetical protein
VRPFEYPRHKHTRRLTPGPFKNYRHYKPALQDEFAHLCIYCRLPDGMKGYEAFGVEHYRPKSVFPGLVAEYSNLFYACNVCNTWKGNYWPGTSQRRRGAFFPNPCDHEMSAHLRFKGATPVAVSPTGTFTIETLGLDDEDAEAYREFVLGTIAMVNEKRGEVQRLIGQLRGKQKRTRDPAVSAALQAAISRWSAEEKKLAARLIRLRGT